MQPCFQAESTCDPVAQSVEHLTFNQVVAGSTPARITTLHPPPAIMGHKNPRHLQVHGARVVTGSTPARTTTLLQYSIKNPFACLRREMGDILPKTRAALSHQCILITKPHSNKIVAINTGIRGYAKDVLMPPIKS